MRKKAAPDAVDRSRTGMLVHDCRSSGREVHLVAYIEGLEGDTSRLEVDTLILCRTQEQAAEMARILHEAMFVQPGRS